MAVWIVQKRRPGNHWGLRFFVLAVVASTPFYSNLFAAQFNLVVLCSTAILFTLLVPARRCSKTSVTLSFT